MINDIIHLKKSITFDVFDYQTLISALSNYSQPRDKITKMLANGIIIRIKKGLYCFNKNFRKEPLYLEYIANLIYGPSYISLKYALSYYGLIPERVNAVMSVTTQRSKDFNTPIGFFSYKMLTDKRYSIGADLYEKTNMSYLIATPEKALIDEIWNDKRLHDPSVSDFETYLLNDLRIDFERLNTLSKARLISIAEVYNSKKIDNLVKSIIRLRSGIYA